MRLGQLLRDTSIHWLSGAEEPRSRWRAFARRVIDAPLVMSYIAVSWLLFMALAEPVGLGLVVDHDRIRSFQYHIPDLTDNIGRLIRSLCAAVFLNWNSTQLFAVTVLLLLFGVAFERREGSGRALLVYYSSAIAGALASGILLYLLRLLPGLATQPVLELAWERTWSGGSIGCFGLIGGLAARSARPGLLLGAVLVVETFNGALILRSYTPVFHLSALLVGYITTSCLPAPPKPIRSHAGRDVRERIAC
jgi:hypothetical protein